MPTVNITFSNRNELIHFQKFFIHTRLMMLSFAFYELNYLMELNKHLNGVIQNDAAGYI